MIDFFKDPEGPIESFSWGKFVIRGEVHAEGPDKRIGKGKDIRIVGGEVSRWKERRGHILKKDMITEIYGRGIKILIIGTGAAGAITVPQAVIDAIEEHGIKRLIIVNTPQACEEYNHLYRKKERVALLAHGTC